MPSWLSFSELSKRNGVMLQCLAGDIKLSKTDGERTVIALHMHYRPGQSSLPATEQVKQNGLEENG